MTQLKITRIAIIIMMIMISTIFQNNTKKLEKMTYFIFTSFGGVMITEKKIKSTYFYLQFWACLYSPTCYMPLTGVESCYKNTIDYM